MAKKELGMGVVGLGMGRNALQVNHDPDSRIEARAICDTDPARIEEYKAKFQVPFATTTFEDLLERDDLHIIAIFTPDHLHVSQCEAALRAGKHVVVTKPMVVSLEDAERLVQVVDETGLKLLVGETNRYQLSFLAAKRLYDDGDLGEVVFAEAHYLHDIRPVFDKTPWRYAGPYIKDILFGSACHPIDTLLWFLGDPEEVHCLGRRSGTDPRYPQEDTFLANIRFKSGAIARMMTSFGVIEPHLPMNGLRVFGTKGTFADETVVLDKLTGLPRMDLTFPSEFEHDGEVVRYLKHFEECILEDRRPSPDVRDGAKVAAIAAACWASVRTGEVVKVRTQF
ncbi:MAG: Gfo/Idh/MocA family protein [Chloroflexota bacterium]